MDLRNPSINKFVTTINLARASQGMAEVPGTVKMKSPGSGNPGL
jgi:hypothetical protein